jgi:hypothetical protein
MTETHQSISNKKNGIQLKVNKKFRARGTM